MKTKQMITGLIAFSTSVLMAQTTDKAAASPDKQATVRIKKIEIINGVEKITDTTYTTSDLSAAPLGEGNVSIKEIKDKDGKLVKVVVIDDEKGALNDKGESIAGHVILLEDETMKKHHEELLKQHDAADKDGKTVIIKTVDCTSKGGDAGKGKQDMQITIIKKINISDASAEDMRLLGKPAAGTDGKLTVEKMDFYPNPNSGRFNLSFTLPDKGDVEVKVLDIKGQQVFNEKLPNFSGSYAREVDITKNPKGIYFVRVEQGQHALVKKVVVD